MWLRSVSEQLTLPFLGSVPSLVFSAVVSLALGFGLALVLEQLGWQRKPDSRHPRGAVHLARQARHTSFDSWWCWSLCWLAVTNVAFPLHGGMIRVEPQVWLPIWSVSVLLPAVLVQRGRPPRHKLSFSALPVDYDTHDPWAWLYHAISAVRVVAFIPLHLWTGWTCS